MIIADDHPIVRHGLRLSLAKEESIELVAETGDGEDALRLIEQIRPDIAVLDIGMPSLNGLEVAKRIFSLGMQTKVIFLTLHKDEDYFRAAMDAGADGYLLKDNATEEIVAGVEAIVAGRSYVSSAMARHLSKPAIRDADSPWSKIEALLSPAELQILKLIALGKSSKEIGIALSLSYRTIENTRTNMCRKLAIEGTNALLRFALEHRNYLCVNK